MGGGASVSSTVNNAASTAVATINSAAGALGSAVIGVPVLMRDTVVGALSTKEGSVEMRQKTKKTKKSPSPKKKYYQTMESDEMFYNMIESHEYELFSINTKPYKSKKESTALPQSINLTVYDTAEKIDLKEAYDRLLVENNALRRRNEELEHDVANMLDWNKSLKTFMKSMMVEKKRLNEEVLIMSRIREDNEALQTMLQTIYREAHATELEMEGLIECLTAMEENWSVQEPGHRLIDEIAGARKASQKQHEQRKIASLGTALSKASLSLTKTADAIKRREVKGVDMSLLSNDDGEEVVSSDDQSSVKFRDLLGRSQDGSSSSGCDHHNNGVEGAEEDSENRDDDDDDDDFGLDGPYDDEGEGADPYDDSQDSSSATASNGESLNDFGYAYEDEHGVDNALSVVSSNDSSSVDFTVWGGCIEGTDRVSGRSVTSKRRGIVT